jgi:glycosyltransferase involved in cell wall biosynthesis
MRHRTDWRVGVVVPARDEERLIGRCLSALDVAAARLRRERPHAQVHTVVVLDSCTDATDEIVAAHPEVTAVAVTVGNVGAARAAGVEAVRSRLGSSRRAWVASTDADSAVPDTWLLDQLALADTGVDLVTGFVTTDLEDTPRALRDLAPTRTRLEDGHSQIHGSNLGCTLRAYLRLGGFAPVTAHEDVGLVERARRHGMRCHASGTLRVLTSGRVDGRAPDGFAAYLRTLAPELAEEPA